MNQTSLSALLLFFSALLFSCNSNSNPLQQESERSVISPNATYETKALFENLDRIRHEYTLFGHQDALAYGVHWLDEPGRSDVKETSGSYPAVYGWELGDIELGASENLDGVNFDSMRGWIIEGFERGGVITIGWHMNNPVTGGNAWDISEGAVDAVLPGGSHHDTFNTWLDVFADFADNLTTEDGTKIPVLFRPFHEMNGTWFWWGIDHTSAESYQKLWRHTVAYLRDEKKLTNLLYVYSPDAISRLERKEDFFNWYPGDDYVDIIGLDDYHTVIGRFGFGGEDPVATLSHHLAWMVEEAEKRGKIPVFSETGDETVQTEDWYTGKLLQAIQKEPAARRIAYVLVWRNANESVDREDHYYVPYPGHPAAEDFIRFRNDPSILFEDDLPDLYVMPAE